MVSKSCTFCKELGLVATHFDEALVWSFDQMAKQDLELAHWWGVYRDIAALVVCPTTFATVLGCGGCWASVPNELAALCSASRIGAKCFGHAQSFVVGSVMAQFVTTSLKELTGQAELKTEALHLYTHACISEAQKQNTSATLAVKRTIALDYRGIKLDLQVVNFQEDTTATCLSNPMMKSEGVRPRPDQN